MDIAIGVDIGATYTKIGIVDQKGQVLTKGKIPTGEDPEVDNFFNELQRSIKDLVNNYDASVELKGIGVGAPDGNYYSGNIENATNLPWDGIVPFVEKSKKYFDIPVLLTNDANAAAIGEMKYGAARGMTDFIVITLGTGLGSGIVANGKVLYGNSGFAGELGHITVDINGRKCGCGRRGCLETYVSATGVKRTVFELMADLRVKSELRNYSYKELSTRSVTEAAEKGDPIALQAFDKTGEILGIKLADTILYTDPEAIFLTGGLTKAGDFLFKPTEKYMKKHVMKLFEGRTKLLKSGLKEQHAAIIGASSLIWNHINSHQSVDI